MNQLWESKGLKIAAMHYFDIVASVNPQHMTSSKRKC